MDMNDKETKKELRRDTLILIITLAVLILASLCMYSCRSAKEVRTEQTRDSVRTEIRIHKVFVPDTVLVPLPPQKEYIITPDIQAALLFSNTNTAGKSIPLCPTGSSARTRS